MKENTNMENTFRDLNEAQAKINELQSKVEELTD